MLFVRQTSKMALVVSRLTRATCLWLNGARGEKHKEVAKACEARRSILDTFWHLSPTITTQTGQLKWGDLNLRLNLRPNGGS